jgi:predicted DNA-binding transcriptional regulator AlpA
MINLIAPRRLLEEFIVAQRVIRINKLATTPGNAGRLPVSPATIWRWVREGKFPKPFKLGQSVTVWDLDLVESFIAQRAGDAVQGLTAQNSPVARSTRANLPMRRES